MLNCLRFDLFKLVKTKSIIIIVAISFLLDLVFSVLMKYKSLSNDVVFGLFEETGNLSCELLSQIVTILFVCKDFTSGYAKNFYTMFSKIKYVISKLIAILIFISTFLVAYFLLCILSIYIFGCAQFSNETYTLTRFLGKTLWRFAVTFTQCVVVLFICFALKKEYLVLLTLLPWTLYLQPGPVMNFLNATIAKDISNLYYPQIVLVDFREIGLFNMNYANPSGIFADSFGQYVLLVFYSVTAFLWSYLLYKKKKI